LFTVLVILLNKAFTVRMSSAVGEESLVWWSVFSDLFISTAGSFWLTAPLSLKYRLQCLNSFKPHTADRVTSQPATHPFKAAVLN
jgi:hypothetical protein